MFGYARLVVTDDGTYVRFENVGRREIFNQVMLRFNRSFPLKAWDESLRTWKLPSGDSAQLVEFCKDIFGTNGYVIEQERITSA